MAQVDSESAVAVCFSVEIDGHDLGLFTSCEGLELEIEVEQREEGGLNSYVHQLPGRISYSNVKLTRPVNGDTGKVTTWFASMATGVSRTTARIAAMTAEGTVVAEWSLTGVIPVRWSGPSMGADRVEVAKESLELAHHGFLESGGAGMPAAR